MSRIFSMTITDVKYHYIFAQLAMRYRLSLLERVY